MLAIIKKGTTKNLTEHLNKVDPTWSIKFTCEEEDQGKIPFFGHTSGSKGGWFGETPGVP